MLLRAGYIALALKLQEAATSVSMEEIRSRISACLQGHYSETGEYAWLVDVMGDDKSGKCVFSCAAGFHQADYKLRTTDSKATCTIDFEGAIGVVPHTTYKATESQRPDSSGDGTQRRSEGTEDNGSTHAVPSSGNHGAGHGNGVGGGELNGASNRESGIRQTRQNDSIQLVESASTLERIILREAKADYEIKLIAPGKGSSAFYPAEVLKRDGPKVFKEGTHVYLNHPTAAEEAQRPEGDVKNLAGVLTTGAVYHEAHAKGEGLYARMKVFADHAQTVEEKASHVGMSIRASGIAEASKKHDGLPVLKELTGAESVDVVTKAGAGGMILTEAARTANPTEEAAMDAAELTKLTEGIKAANDAVAATNAINSRLLERALRGDAREEAQRILAGITLPDASKARVVEAVLGSIPKTEAGELDKVKFTEAVNAAAKAEGVYVAGLIGSGNVTGLGTPAPIETTEAAKPEDILAHSVKTFQRLGLSEAAAKAAVMGRVA